MNMESRNYYNRLVLKGRRNTPSMGEVQRDLASLYVSIHLPYA
jgi:hypothetical protein